MTTVFKAGKSIIKEKKVNKLDKVNTFTFGKEDSPIVKYSSLAKAICEIMIHNQTFQINLISFR